MPQIVFKALNAVGIIALVLAVAPLAIAAMPFVLAWRVYRLMELKAVYGGDEAVRDRTEYKYNF